MLTITTDTFYESGRRGLRASLGLEGITCWFRWNPTPPTPPSVQFSWLRYGAKPGHTDTVHIKVLPRDQIARVGWADHSFRHPKFLWVNRETDLPYPAAAWSDLLTVARFVAARRAPAVTLLGWIEDNLPEPWCLFASLAPVEAIKALCPMPLSIRHNAG